MQQQVDEDNTRKTADAARTHVKNLAPSWKRLPVGWIVLGLVVVSWIAFLLMTNGVASLMRH